MTSTGAVRIKYWGHSRQERTSRAAAAGVQLSEQVIGWAAGPFQITPLPGAGHEASDPPQGEGDDVAGATCQQRE